MTDTFSRIWNFSKKRHKNLINALVLSFFRSVLAVTQLIAIIVAINVLYGRLDVKSGVTQIALLTIVCVVGNFITSYFEQINTLKSGFFMTADQRVDVGNHLRKMPLGYFNDTSSGKICASLTTTLTNIETACAMTMVGIVSGLFSTLSLFVFMLFYDYRIGIISGVGMAVYLIIVNYQMKLSRNNAPMLQKSQNNLAKTTFSFLQGIKVIKSFSFENGDKNMKIAIKDSCDANISLTSKSMPSQFASSICIAVFESVILIASLYFCLQTENIDIIKIIVLLIYSFMVYSSLNQAGSMLSMIGLLDTGLSEIEKIKNEEELKQQMPEEKALSNRIVLDNVCFSYGDKEILHNISVTIEPNSFTALIGPSGSGKTTLCQLISRFRDVSSGKITIGDADIRYMNDEELMKKISMVFQKVYLFEDTILNNIRFGNPDASLEQVRQAAKAAYCDDFIMALPDGYNTIIKEGGNSLSGGEKQRISIARAILKNSPIVILDEATSALDAENEYEILNAINELIKDKTVIMIAHRIKSVEKANHIIALKNGKVVQEGTHTQLKNVKGLYADFISSREQASVWKIST